MTNAAPDPALATAEAAIALVAKALTLCESAGLDLAAIFLTDALDVLDDPDDPDQY